MIYSSAKDWQGAPHKRVALFGMSGLGKTRLVQELYGQLAAKRQPRGTYWPRSLGWRDAANLPSFPPLPSHADPKLKSNLPRWRTVRDVIADLPFETIGTEIGSQKTLNLHFGRTPTEKSLQRYRAVPPGGNRFHRRLPPH